MHCLGIVCNRSYSVWVLNKVFVFSELVSMLNSEHWSTDNLIVWSHNSMYSMNTKLFWMNDDV